LRYKRDERSGAQQAKGGTGLLKTLTRLHTPELLHALASMGHGDELALVDAHFPSVSMARRIVRLDGADLPEALAACLRLIPLDTFVPDPALRMEMADDPLRIPEVQKACQEVIDKAEGRHVPLAGIERHAFYERAKKAYAILATGEMRPYGCILIKKGVALPN
jgi:L-fucose mutarotase